MSTDTPWSTPQDSVPEDPAPSPRNLLALLKDRRDDISACVVIALLSVLLAFAVGAMWRWISPPVLGVYSQHTAFYAAPEGKTFIARDGWFALFACIAAILLAVFAFARYRKDAGTGATLGLVGGGFGAGYLAARFGAYIGPGHGSVSRAIAHLADGSVFDLPLTVRATGVIWLWPAVAVGLFFFLMLLFGPSDPPHPDQNAGWGEELAGRNGRAPHESPPPDPMQSDPLRPEPLRPEPLRSQPVRPDTGPTEFGPSGPASSASV